MAPKKRKKPVTRTDQERTTILTAIADARAEGKSLTQATKEQGISMTNYYKWIRKAKTTAKVTRRSRKPQDEPSHITMTLGTDTTKEAAINLLTRSIGILERLVAS